MPRGAKKSIPDTAARKFKHKKSFVSQDGHEYLVGKDKTRRIQEFMDSVNAYCAECGSTYGLEVDHIQGGLVGRCDCSHNLQWLCRTCYREKHVQVKWTNVSTV